MYRPTIKSKLWLGIMTVIFVVLSYWSENSLVIVKSSEFSEKMEAARTMKSAIETLVSHRLPGMQESEVNSGQDPLVYTMLGEKDSPITTDEGQIDDKITVLNPNFAAAMVEMLVEAGVKENDIIAVMMTGSMPGANIALFSAAKALKVDVVSIVSVGSSWWGANDPTFTWLDMETVLEESDVWDFKSVGASIGGSDDHGGIRLSFDGKSLIKEAIVRNNVTLLYEGNL